MELQIRSIAMVTIFSFLLSHNLAQVQQEECMKQLQPCMNYLNDNNHPPESCCQPLDYIIKSMPECLCSLMTIQGANQAEQAGINVTEAQTLPGRCGQHINPLGCVTGTPDKRSRDALPTSLGSGLRFSSLSMVVAAIFVILLVL